MHPLAIVADVTEMETRPPAHPEQVAALEALGFRALGRFATLTRPSRDDAAYAARERARLDEWRHRPAATVLVAPDGSAFAGVDTLGDARMLRLRTELDDGSVVETVGLERAGALLPRFRRDPLATFKAVRTPDHAVRLVEDPSPDTVIAEHADHVTATAERRGAQPVRHLDRDHALRLASLHADHLSRVVQRWRLVTRVLALAVLLAVGTVGLWVEYATGMSLPVVILTDLLLVAIVLAAVVGVMAVVARTSWWRPSYLVDR